MHALRLRASIFGHNAPDWRTMPAPVRESYLAAAGQRGTAVFDQASSPQFDEAHVAPATQWPGFALTDPSNGDDGPVIELDAAYPALLPGSWLVLRAPGSAGRAVPGRRGRPVRRSGLHPDLHHHPAAAARHRREGVTVRPPRHRGPHPVRATGARRRTRYGPGDRKDTSARTARDTDTRGTPRGDRHHRPGCPVPPRST